MADGFDGLYILRNTHTTGVNQMNTTQPDGYILHQNYPNPFNAETVIRYEIPQSDEIRIDVYNMAGQHVRSLVDRTQSAGRHKVTWDGSTDTGTTAGFGVYIIQINFNGFTGQRKAIMIK
ncbi:MAG: T9SS type A sorting domain-containing protein [candidate division KSB1 bacterium]|nr:T9SS type A sorting domain-containing protein [candidate division KSB1 bacterium]